MDKTEVKTVLERELLKYKQLRYEKLLEIIDEAVCFSCKGDSGAEYQIEVEAFYDDEEERNVRVMASLDNGSLRTTFMPYCSDFIIRPDGSFVDE